MVIDGFPYVILLLAKFVFNTCSYYIHMTHSVKSLCTAVFSSRQLAGCWFNVIQNTARFRFRLGKNLATVDRSILDVARTLSMNIDPRRRDGIPSELWMGHVMMVQSKGGPSVHPLNHVKPLELLHIT